MDEIDILKKKHEERNNEIHQESLDIIVNINHKKAIKDDIICIILGWFIMIDIFLIILFACTGLLFIPYIWLVSKIYIAILVHFLISLIWITMRSIHIKKRIRKEVQDEYS